MQDERTRNDMNVGLAEAGYTMRGDLVQLCLQGRTDEIRMPEKSVVIEISIVDSHGWLSPDKMQLERFRKNPVVLFNHDYDGLPVARSLWERIRERDGEYLLTAKVQFHCDTELSRECWELAKANAINRWTIGVLPGIHEVTGCAVASYALVEISCLPPDTVPEGFRAQAPALIRALQEDEIPSASPTTADELRAFERGETPEKPLQWSETLAVGKQVIDALGDEGLRSIEVGERSGLWVSWSRSGKIIEISVDVREPEEE